MEPVEYLRTRIGKVIPESDKIYNQGCVLLANYPLWKFELEEIVEEAWDTLTRYCIRNKSTTHMAAVKLTFVSSMIGTQLASRLQLVDPYIKDILALGDIMIETFLQDDLIDIERAYNGFKAPYMLLLKGDTNGIKPVLVGTSLVPLPPITGLYSPLTKLPFIKGWTDRKQFEGLLNERFVKALEVLRGQGWKINFKVLNAALKNKPQETVEIVDADGVITEVHYTDPKHKNNPKVQRLASKKYEHEQVIKKALMLIDKTFYQEVSCDYRGRVYYSESFLSYQGGDLARSLFLFDNEKEVTKSGYRWLCIKAATSYNSSYDINEIPSWTTTDYRKYLGEEGLDTISVDKMTMDDRFQWAIENMSTITNLGHKSELSPKAEKPYAFLSCCIELWNYTDAAGKPYYSGLPGGIDGLCNGWQHLAAMSKDAQAGALVALTNSPLPSDFYVAVAKSLITKAPDWFASRNLPMKHIRKGIAKRGAMTRAYSSGRRRIAANMYDDLYVLGYNTQYNISEVDCEMLSGKLIDAINEVCKGPLKTTKYLQKIAEHELANGRNELTWVTPSGFPVVYKANLQHEHKQRGTIRGLPGSKTGRVMHVVKTDVIARDTGMKIPCRRSFASGISPNVVHSYDAAHMANTIVAFNGSFAAVHDSFSCHLSDIDLLQDITKMTFAAQYDVPNFFNALEESLMEYKSSFASTQPVLGTLDINEVHNSKYFFC